MTRTITLDDLIATFRGAAANCHNDAGQTLDGDNYDALKQQQASHHAYADALVAGDTLVVTAHGGYRVGTIAPATNRTERATAAAKAFVEAVCALDHNHDAFAAVIRDQHFTHQQSVMRAMYAVMQELAKEQHDMRNEATVKFCRRVTNNGDFFPFI